MTMAKEQNGGDEGRVPRRPGIKEVAERAGVAFSSVSRVLSNHPDVSEVMKHRVNDAVAALGYQPDLLAQGLRTGATMTIGFVAGDISNPLMSEIAFAAEVELRKANYSMLLTNSTNRPELDVAHVRLLNQRRVDGVMLSVTDESDGILNALLKGLTIPAVLVDRQIKGLSVSAVLSDHASGIEAAVDHLAELGHRRIGLVNGNPRVRPARQRAAGLRNAARKHEGVTVAVRSTDFSAASSAAATHELLASPEPPTAVIAGSNQILVGVLEAFRELGVSVPGDLSLVTCDHTPLAKFLTPEISTISRSPTQIGMKAAQLLLDQLKGGAAQVAVLPTHFRPTSSCAAPKSRVKVTVRSGQKAE